MKVFTYYQPIHRSPIWDEEEQRKLIQVWAKSWRKYGWDPILLSEKSLETHPRGQDFKRRFFSMPSFYGHDFDGPCMLRYAAVAAQKEALSMMTDYDVINYGFTPEEAERLSRASGGPRLVFFSTPVTANCGATLGPWQLFEGMSQIFFQWIPDQFDFRDLPGYRGFDCTENNMLLRMKRGNYTKPDWVQWEPGNIVWSKPGWETAKTVHYGFEMKAAGYWPKWKFIEQLRPI